MLNPMGLVLEMTQPIEGDLLLKQAQGEPGPICNTSVLSSSNNSFKLLPSAMMPIQHEKRGRRIQSGITTKKGLQVLVNNNNFGGKDDKVEESDIHLSQRKEWGSHNARRICTL